LAGRAIAPKVCAGVDHWCGAGRRRFDFAFKANDRNERLLEVSQGPPEQVQALRRRSGWTVAAALAVPALVLLLALVVAGLSG
jgi:predicted dithiol-disulfide oxidoreductase (DUF899 family)